jgi:hypothetical protein
MASRRNDEELSMEMSGVAGQSCADETLSDGLLRIRSGKREHLFKIIRGS